MTLTVGELKKILADMDDNALVLARAQDCILLSRVDVVGHPNSGAVTKQSLYHHEHVSDVYGGGGSHYVDLAQAIILCCNG